MYIRALILIGAVGGAFWFGLETGADRVQVKWDAEKKGVLIAQQKVIDDARAKEAELFKKIEQLKKEYVNENARIRDRLTIALNSLRDRPQERAKGDTGLPEGSASGVGCTGKGLARGDAEFLSGYAADAARLQSAIEQCKAQYERLTK